MRCDANGLSLSSVSSDAQAAFDTAVYGLAAHRPNTGAALEDTLRSDPDHVAAHVLKGFANLILARSELVSVANESLTRARLALETREDGTQDERVLVSALEDACSGSFAGAARRLDAGFSDRPATFLPFKIAHALRFMIGDSAGMLAMSRRAMEHWSDGIPAAGFILGCHAFALEEHGFYDAAEAAGRRAVALQPHDSWGLHAVSHVYEMRGATSLGIDWLESGRASWSRCNNFSFHMAWHLALLHLERGEHERVLQLYDDEVRPQQTDDFRDVANAVSLLWRLDQTGVDVGGRWSDLAETALRRRRDTTLVFASLHTLAALVAIGDRDAVDDLLGALERKASTGGEQAEVAAAVGLPLARVIAGLHRRPAKGLLEGIVGNLPKVGGSNAQRDFFVLALAKAAGVSGDRDGFSRIRSTRQILKAEDRLLSSIEMRAVA